VTSVALHVLVIALMLIGGWMLPSSLKDAASRFRSRL
jgi:hypothetical protein